MKLQSIETHPDLIVEMRLQTDRWHDVLVKVAKYLKAGVTAVCIIDQPTATAHVFYADEAPRGFTADAGLSFPGILGDCRVAVRQFLE